MKALEEGWTVPTAELEGAVVRPAIPAPAPAAVQGKRAESPREEDLSGAESETQRREYELAGEEGFRQYSREGAEQREEFWASFTRTAHFKVLAAQLQLDKRKVPYELLVTNDRLRQALGKYVLDAQKKAAKKPRTTGQAELGLD
jgi:hypothetical protein